MIALSVSKLAIDQYTNICTTLKVCKGLNLYLTTALYTKKYNVVAILEKLIMNEVDLCISAYKEQIPIMCSC